MMKKLLPILALSALLSACVNNSTTSSTTAVKYSPSLSALAQTEQNAVVSLARNAENSKLHKDYSSQIGYTSPKIIAKIAELTGKSVEDIKQVAASKAQAVNVLAMKYDLTKSLFTQTSEGRLYGKVPVAMTTIENNTKYNIDDTHVFFKDEGRWYIGIIRDKSAKLYSLVFPDLKGVSTPAQKKVAVK